MKKTLITACMLTITVPGLAQDILSTGVSLPLQYRKSDGVLSVHSYAKLSCPPGKGNTLYLDGSPLAWEATSQPDSIGLWLPLVGQSNLLEIRGKKGAVSSYRVTAPISDDWGYFANGEINLIQSSHQDIAWMDVPDYCREERINDIIIPALDLMKEDPDLTFEMEQTLNLMEFLEAHPERKDEVIQRYRERRFFWGATFNQPYEGLSSGEQLVRQLYFGRKWIKDNLPGCDDRTAFNVDVPGRVLQMPQILAKSGVRNLFISRFGEGYYDWESPDGSSVLTYSPGNYGWATLEWKFFDGDVLTAFDKLHKRLALWDEYYAQHKLPPYYCVLMSCDATKPHSYTAIFDEWNRIAELSDIPLPRVRYANADTFLERMDTPEAERERIKGERPNLWLYIHGPAHYEQTVDKRRAAILLPAAEQLASLNSILLGAGYPAAKLARGWMASIYPDHGLGGKNGDITDRIFGDSLAVGRKMGEEVMERQMTVLADAVKGKKGEIILYNDLPETRSGLVRLPGILPFVATVPGFGYAAYNPKALPENAGQVVCGPNYCSNAFYDISFGPGGITRLWDKRLEADIVENEKYALGDIYNVSYLGNGAGEFTEIKETSPYDGKSLAAYQPSAWQLTENTPLYAVFESHTQTPFTLVKQRITVHHWTGKIDFDVTLENFTGEHNKQYRILFPLKMKLRDSDIRYQTPAAISRVGEDELDRKPMGWAAWGSYVHYPADSHPREIQQFITASGKEFGATLSSCVAVADWIDPAREIADYTVLQGVLLSAHKSCHGEGNWYAQEGTHHYHFSLATHAPGWQNGYHQAIAENHPFHAHVKTNGGGTLPRSQSLVSLSDPYVSVMALKRADDGSPALILRIAEMEGRDKKVALTLPLTIRKAVKCSMIEEEQETLPLSGQTLELSLGHHAIETYKLYY